MMATKPTLELTWNDRNNQAPEPRIRITLANDPHEETALTGCYELTLDICPEPRCGGIDIRFQCCPSPVDNKFASHTAPLCEFWIDFQDGTISWPKESHKKPNMRLPNILLAELTEADHVRLREWFFAEKITIIQTTPPSEIDITDLPDASGGKMIGFVDVFPCGLSLNFTWNNEVWTVDEQYCVQSNCKCQETVLSFIRLMDATGKKIKSSKNPPALRYNYRSEISKTVAKGSANIPPMTDLIAALKQKHPSLNTQLELRHNIMQILYARQEQERNKSRLQTLATHSGTIESHKTGRNEPCPCGSGRKYKHCCLNKRST